MLSDRVWGASNKAELTTRWHHLLAAVGNFKRQRGTVLDLPPLDTGEQRRRDGYASVINTPHGVRLSVDDPHSWRDLQQSVSGLGVATTTTLLSALWPDQHVIIDRLALRAAIGLAGPTDDWEHPLPDSSGTRSEKVTWNWYGWYRVRVLLTAEDAQQPPRAVERALFIIGSSVGSERGRTWEAYAQTILDEFGS